MALGKQVGWFYESAAERKNSGYETPSSSFGAFQKEGVKSLDDRFNDLYEQYKESHGIDIKFDTRAMLADRPFMEEYKKALMEPVFTGFREASPNDPHIEHVIKNVETFWDTKVRNYTESATMTGFLPIATLEFPVLLKQFFQSILKDIIEVESVKTPNITKHIRSTFMVDNQTGAEYEYPKCMFDGTWQNLMGASRGHQIREVVVPLDFDGDIDAQGVPGSSNPATGRLFRYNIITNLTESTDPDLDMLSFEFKIVGVQVGADIIRLRGNGITFEFSTGGTIVNGDIDFDYNGTRIVDTLGGKADFRAGTIDLSSSAGVVTGVVFQGFLSNEKNLRHISVREKRDILRFTIADGPRWNMPFSIEEIEDAAALLDINYYNRMVDEIVRTQEMQECMHVIRWLDRQFQMYEPVTPDIYELESLSQTFYVDIRPPATFAGDPFKYISTAIQFRLKALIHQITEMLKLDNLSFVIVGNPMATQLIAEFIQWKVQQGSSIGGITVNNSYGFATDMGANIRVVATNLYDAYTVDADRETSDRELVLHIYGYPTTAEHISYRHLKYTSHLFTSQSQTAYQSTNAPGGAYNIVTATSRFETISVQGIQGRLVMRNSDIVYGTPPARPPIVGAPWDTLGQFGVAPDPTPPGPGPGGP